VEAVLVEERLMGNVLNAGLNFVKIGTESIVLIVINIRVNDFSD
jgi:hypothetical protein